MDDAAKLELEHRVSLYQFYLSCYIKGIAFFMAITAVLLKFALDPTTHSRIFANIGIVCSMAILIPLIFGLTHEKQIADDFQRLAEATDTQPIRTTPLRMLSIATACFWVIVICSWVYIWTMPYKQ